MRSFLRRVKISKLDFQWKKDLIMNMLLKDKRPTHYKNNLTKTMDFKNHIKNKETIKLMKKRFEK